MNENINLCEILKDAPEGLPLWSPMFGDVTFNEISIGGNYPIHVDEPDGEIQGFTPEGYYYKGKYDAECVLFPSKEQRDWSKFTLPGKEQETETVILHPFDRVLVRDKDNELWHAALFSNTVGSGEQFMFMIIDSWLSYYQCIPYNSDTAHLLCTAEKSDKKYIIQSQKHLS